MQKQLGSMVIASIRCVVANLEPLLTPFPSCWLKRHFIKSKAIAN